MKRAIVVVVDSMGAGALPDAAEYNDLSTCNTLRNVAAGVGGLNAPTFEKLGLGNITEVKGVKNNPNHIAQFGIMKETSKGKDTTTGHWEMMGLILDEPFQVYPHGFDHGLIDKFIKATGCKGILGNCAASGTKIIEDLHEEHAKTLYPIVYTSADSVFQIAVDIDLIPIEKLYEYCEIARKILDDGYNVSRVIARPYKMIDGKPSRISALRHDYSVVPFKDTLCNEVMNNNGRVFGIGKIEDIFVGSGITHAIHTGSNTEGLNLTLKAIKNEMNLDELKVADCTASPDKYFIFTNLVDTDMLYGHRNNVEGYAKAIEEIDTYIPKFIENMSDEDLLIITADHGCDPTVPGTDHTREQVPLLVYHKNIKPENLGVKDSFTYVADTIRNWLF
ncbi:MAG: phosphopentomutase [Candidatus Gastranaerophilales bacterium]|nr:phosphopentomutase [Candidatus Gastranaerophilales bacterium]